MESKGKHAASADSLSVAVRLVSHLHDLHHVEVNGLIRNSDGQHSIYNSLQTRQEAWSRLQENQNRSCYSVHYYILLKCVHY